MKPKHGGKRSNAGRKPVADKKITLTIFPKQSEIDAVGGTDAAKALALKAVEDEASRLKKLQ